MRKLLFTGLILVIIQSLFGQISQDITLSSTINGNVTIIAQRTITLSPGFHVPQGTKFTAQIDYFATTENHFDYNYVKTETALIAGVTGTGISSLTEEQKSTVFNYFDGLGRPVQTVAVKASPTKNDIIQHVEYDEFGR